MTNRTLSNSWNATPDTARIPPLSGEARLRPRRPIHIDVPGPKRFGRNYWLLLLPSALGVLVGSLWLWLRTPVIEEKFWTGTVKAGELRVGIGGHGSLIPSGILTVTSTTGGSVASIHAFSGAKVQKGDVIATLTNTELLQQVSAAEKTYSDRQGEQATSQAEAATKRVDLQAALDNSKDALELANVELTTQSELAESGVTSRLEVQKARAKVAAAQRQVEQGAAALKCFEDGNRVHVRLEATAVAVAKSELERLRTQANELVLRAPEAGVVYELSDGITVGSTVNVGTLIAKIATESELKAELRVPSSHAGELTPGQIVDLRAGEKQMIGRVERIDPRVQQDEVRVSVALDESQARGLLPGQPVSGDIVVDKLQDVVYVIRPAGIADGTAAVVFEVNRDRHRLLRREVKFGKSEGRYIVVESGLTLGEEIVLSEMDKMKSYKEINYKE
jgi:HlyD family secretion protein